MLSIERKDQCYFHPEAENVSLATGNRVKLGKSSL